MANTFFSPQLLQKQTTFTLFLIFLGKLSTQVGFAPTPQGTAVFTFPWLDRKIRIIQVCAPFHTQKLLLQRDWIDSFVQFGDRWGEADGRSRAVRREEAWRAVGCRWAVESLCLWDRAPPPLLTGRSHWPGWHHMASFSVCSRCDFTSEHKSPESLNAHRHVWRILQREGRGGGILQWVYTRVYKNNNPKNVHKMSIFFFLKLKRSASWYKHVKHEKGAQIDV